MSRQICQFLTTIDMTKLYNILMKVVKIVKNKMLNRQWSLKFLPILLQHKIFNAISEYNKNNEKTFIS